MVLTFTLIYRVQIYIYIYVCVCVCVCTLNIFYLRLMQQNMHITAGLFAIKCDNV